ncbi:bifunctional diguanylate cyclase/phosphodiesterase [Actinotalea sp. M2MS4P-6]|uniref:putative bifunctional diguanylate cyclase/phosphodiesterase n=1 Tax=Actinotalea sp. M2MS4P-6 TaxID=2983762 RepID=UPI0021E4C021|nr:bifunctional diguanylate cyclase/phosphodiesterase [Actinotalea sp. M2MS4P-6]MCV2392752.1 bifunctional diguanylate cyclase/phosphodiesterase [Actinotalea sp. M2MS4P-6]
MSDSAGLRLVHRVLVVLSVAAGLAYAAHAVVTSGASGTTDALLLAAALTVLALLGAVRALRAWPNPGDLLFALGLLLAVAAWLYWAIVLAPMPDPPYPSAADVLWIARFPLTFASLAWHVGRSPAARRAFVFDILIGSAGITAAVAAFVVPAVQSGAANPDDVGVNAVYVGANIAHLLLIVAVIAMRRGSVPAGLWRRLGGASLLVLTNAFFLTEVADTGVIPSGTILSAGWIVAYALYASSIGTPVPVERRTVSRVSVLLVPLAGAALALVVLLDHDAPTAPRWIAAAAVVLALGRMGLAFIEAEALAGSHRLAHTDELTGLVNRRGFYEAIRRCLGSGDTASVVLLDLNRFKEVNDTLGHHAGDLLLMLVARRLASETRSGDRGRDVVARIGGDEFALLLRRSSVADGERAAGRLLEALAGVYDLGDVVVRASAAGGLVHLPEHGTEPDELLRRADVAMYQAKASGDALKVYDEDLDTHTVAELGLQDRVQTALTSGGLVLHYQPKVELRTGSLVGVEALARLRLDDGELMMPGLFLPMLSRTGDLGQLTVQVLDLAVAQAAAWREAGHELAVAVNVPAEALVGADFGDQVRDALGRHDLPGRLLYLEVTEESLLQDRDAGRASLLAARALGARVSIDDYGTGYSSLTYLRELPLDEIKIDRSFVHGMAGDSRATRIVHSTVLLAHGLGLTVVAEGVETTDDRNAVRVAGCDLAQGFLFARPVRGEEITQMLREARDRPADTAS